MQWYYLSDSHERIAFSEAQFAALVARGILRPVTPVWRKGISGWVPCGEVKPEIFAAAVVRHSDGHNPVIDESAARGTVIGISRTLAAYCPWLRIVGVFILIHATVAGSVLGWQTYLISRLGFEKFMDSLTPVAVPAGDLWVIWLLLGLQILFVALGIWSGLLLLRSAGRARRAAESGSELALSGAIRDAGRTIIIAAVAFILSTMTALGLFLWLGRDKAFPKAPAKADKGLVI